MTEEVLYCIPSTLRLVNLSSKQLWISKSNRPISVRPMCVILLPAPKIVSALLETGWECSPSDTSDPEAKVLKPNSRSY